MSARLICNLVSLNMVKYNCISQAASAAAQGGNKLIHYNLSGKLFVEGYRALISGDLKCEDY